MAPRLKLFLPLALFALLALFLARGLELDPKEMPSALIDRPFPEFDLPQLGTDSRLLRADVVGEPALFNVWATWCVSCRVEHPYLQALSEQGVVIYGINYKDDGPAALKWLENLGDPYIANIVDSSGSLGLDLGVLQPHIWKNLAFGVKLQDITTTYLHWSTGRNEYVTPAIVPALAWKHPIPSANMEVNLAGSLETRFDNRRTADQYWTGSMSANSHLGLEIGFSGKVFLRGGYDSGWSAKNLTAGAGFRINPLTIDYAYAGDSLDIDEVTHRISLSIRF